MTAAAPSSSLRRTLAVRFSLTMFAALLALACWAFLGARQTLMEQLDQSLRGSAQLQANALAVLPEMTGESRLPAYCFIRDVNRLVVVRDSSGMILGSNTKKAGDLPLQVTLFRESRRSGPQLSTHQWRGSNFRSIYVAVPPSSTGATVIQVEASLAPLEGSLRSILLQMMATVLLGSLATAIGAGWLAGSAVAPVTEIAQQARAITGEIPGQRITAHASVSEFRGLTEVINAMLLRLEQACHWHRNIIRDLGHDLRTPVTAMRAAVEVALWQERSPDEYRRVLSETLEEIDRMSLICDALVFLARLQAGEVSLKLDTLDARLLARQAVAGARETMSRHTMELVEPSQPVLIQADVRLTRIVLDQLLDNARRYTPPGSHIEVVVHDQDGMALITVEDDGPGVSDEVLPHLFEPFYRSDSARGRDGGPGLGLTATSAIVTLHGGSVTATRGRKGGLRVTVALPLVDRAQISVIPIELPRRAKHSDSPLGGVGERVGDEGIVAGLPQPQFEDASASHRDIHCLDSREGTGLGAVLKYPLEDSAYHVE
jgi:two-component system, OmpR family, sensor kinase